MIVLRVGEAGSVKLVDERQVQHDVGRADKAAVVLVDHLNVTPTLAITGCDLAQRYPNATLHGECRRVSDCSWSPEVHSF